jgi:hypothetical protein
MYPHRRRRHRRRRPFSLPPNHDIHGLVTAR